MGKPGRGQRGCGARTRGWASGPIGASLSFCSMSGFCVGSSFFSRPPNDSPIKICLKDTMCDTILLRLRQRPGEIQDANQKVDTTLLRPVSWQGEKTDSAEGQTGPLVVFAELVSSFGGLSGGRKLSLSIWERGVWTSCR